MSETIRSHKFDGGKSPWTTAKLPLLPDWRALASHVI